MKNEKALQAFMAKVEEVKALLDELQAHVDDHMSADPDGVNYAQGIWWKD